MIIETVFNNNYNSKVGCLKAVCQYWIFHYKVKDQCIIYFYVFD